MIEVYDNKITMFKKENAEIKEKAEKLNSIIENELIRSRCFRIAVIFFQVGVVLAATAGLMKKRYLWICGLIAGVVGIVYFVNGFLAIF